MTAMRRLRHLQRYREIALAFARNGFGYFVRDLGLNRLIPHWRSVESQHHQPTRTTGERLRSFLQELGPTFVKLGQIASTRHDLFPPDIIEELQRLQDKVPPIPFEDVRRVIEEELGSPLESVYRSFEPEPVAAASIGQVHRARLRSGEEVAVKVQRPGIRRTVETDLDILRHLARIAEHRLQLARQYGASELVEELASSLGAELDYTLEGRSAERIAAHFEGRDDIRIPRIWWDLSSRRVLTMEFMRGIQLHDTASLAQAGYDLTEIAEAVSTVILEQVFLSGHFHADPHPGNVLVLPPPTSKRAGRGRASARPPGEDGSDSGAGLEQTGQAGPDEPAPAPRPVIGLLDFGMTGRLTPGMKEHFASLVIALRRQSTDGVIQAIEAMGLIPDSADWQELRRDVDRLREKYYQVSFSDISLGEAVTDLFQVSYRHRIRMPADFMLLGKTLLTLEGVISSLDPDFSVVTVAEPFGKKLLLDRLKPARLAEAAASYAAEYVDLLGELPSRLRSLGRHLTRGKLPLELSVKDVDRMMKKLDRISGRLSFSIVLLSFSIIMAGLVVGSSIGRQPGLLSRFPVLEIGFTIAAVMFLYMLVSIFRSGRK
ncbi:AarF/ABC1/UbiB kinase family protein [Paenibacillus albicereus]|uniref:AarF/ABC1/UbiB kinase family protein n=1 Tax=Paenibacillus albicereus TaxID=2726185 RepID=A0A6H2GT48_9BACL|nr:AarF/ABC1/UbiB kinase family protein [Paenibacillus albicereus]QJC50346.1 AarF/ABC1/UbiB kinase family protein [Paenibacillus albicereus]